MFENFLSDIKKGEIIVFERDLKNERGYPVFRYKDTVIDINEAYDAYYRTQLTDEFPTRASALTVWRFYGSSDIHYRNLLFYSKEDFVNKEWHKEYFWKDQYSFLNACTKHIDAFATNSKKPTPSLIKGVSNSATKYSTGFPIVSFELMKNPKDIAFLQKVYWYEPYISQINKILFDSNKDHKNVVIKEESSKNFLGLFPNEWHSTGYSYHQQAFYGPERLTPNEEIVQLINEHCKLLPNFELTSCNLCWFTRTADHSLSYPTCINYDKDGNQTFKVNFKKDPKNPFEIIRPKEGDKIATYRDGSYSNHDFIFFLGQAWEIYFLIDGQDFLEGRPVYVCTHEQFEEGIKSWKPELFEKDNYYKDIHYLASGWCEQNKTADFHNVLAPIDQPMGLNNWIFSRLVSRVTSIGRKFPGLISHTTIQDRSQRLKAIDKLQALKGR